MDAKSGIAAIRAAAAKKRGAGANLAANLKRPVSGANKGNGGKNEALQGAIARRLAKKPSSDNLVTDNDADDE